VDTLLKCSYGLGVFNRCCLPMYNAIPSCPYCFTILPVGPDYGLCLCVRCAGVWSGGFLATAVRYAGLPSGANESLEEG